MGTVHSTLQYCNGSSWVMKRFHVVINCNSPIGGRKGTARRPVRITANDAFCIQHSLYSHKRGVRASAASDGERIAHLVN